MPVASKWPAFAASSIARPRWKPMIETIVERLLVLPECGHVLSHLCQTLLLDDDASNEIGNVLHFRFSHAQPRHFYSELICDTSLRNREYRNAAARIFRFTHALFYVLHVFVHVPLSTRRWLPNKPIAIV